MKAKQLAEILLRNPELDVTVRMISDRGRLVYDKVRNVNVVKTYDKNALGFNLLYATPSNLNDISSGEIIFIN
jgi:hypothetical protein